MPKELEAKLKKEYPGNDHAVYGTLNKLGLMKGNKETKKGKAYDKKHEMAKKFHHPGTKHLPVHPIHKGEHKEE